MHTQLAVYQVHIAKTNAVEYSSPGINPPFLKDIITETVLREVLIQLYGPFGGCPAGGLYCLIQCVWCYSLASMI